MTRPLRNLWRQLKTGVGGSAVFMGLLDEWEPKMQWKPGRIMLGTSLYEPGQKLGHWDDRHIITIATNRSGKGRSCIIPNLLTWPGSALVIDPKGENAAVTARARRQLGQSVHIVDPFKLLTGEPPQGLGPDPRKFPRHRLNPLMEIRLDDPEAVDQIRKLAAALVMISPNANPFWDESSRNILEGVIAHVMSSPGIPDSERHLGTVREYVTQTNNRNMEDLRTNRLAWGMPEIGYSFYKGASDSAGGDIMTTLNVHMKWIDSPLMKEAMSASDFSFAELKHTESTVYLVIPSDYLETHARYLRLFITLALKAAGRGMKAKHAMLFVLDEFAALGELQVVATAAGAAAGSGVKLWPIIQNLTQLAPYGDNREVFVSNAGQNQIFAMNDQSTARYFAEKLGEHIAWRKTRGPEGMEWVPQGVALLRTGPELARESSRDSEKAVILFEGGDALLVRRAGYDRLFTKEHYDHNPYHDEVSLFSWASVRAEGGLEKWWGVVWDKASRAVGDWLWPPERRAAFDQKFIAWLERQEWMTRIENNARERDRKKREAKKLAKPGAGNAAPAVAPPKPAPKPVMSLDEPSPEPAGQGAGPDLAAAIETAPQEPDAPLPKPLKVLPVKKPARKKPAAKMPTIPRKKPPLHQSVEDLMQELDAAVSDEEGGKKPPP